MGIKLGKYAKVKIYKETHPLTIDQRWHELLANRKTNKIKMLENKLNSLLKEQGQSNNEYKEYTLLKKKLMSDIITDMTDAFDEKKEKTVDNMFKNKKYINTINQKLNKYEKRLSELPQEIQLINGELLEAGMALCYREMMKSKKVLDGIDSRIEKLRDQLKEIIILKNENKEQYDQLYAYMHDLVGSEVIEQFDKIYLGGDASD